MKSALFPMRLMAALSFLVALVSYRFVVLGLSGAFPDMIGHIDLRGTAFAAHVVAAPVALATGAIQFFPELRTGRPWLHRWNGRFYGFAVLAGGVGGLVLSVGAADPACCRARFRNACSGLAGNDGVWHISGTDAQLQ